MRAVAASGRTVILVSHDMRIVQALCDRVALFRNGRLELVGGPDEAIRAYLGKEAPSALAARTS
jgi:ABC-type polysaccharide/polyol phosphate transport system ATPase subunit